MNLEVSVGTYSNDWDFWVYPSLPASSVNRSICVAERLDSAAVQALEAGQSVLLLPDTSMINSNVPPGFSSIFWNTAWTSRQAPHTLGILCNPKHPALRDFPTDFHSNWQWWDLVVNSRAMILDSLNHRLRPVVQVVDDWFTNRKLGLVFEAKVGKGKLLVCSIDLTSDLEKRPVARQLRASLERYVASKEFSPQVSLRISDLRSVFHRTPSESLIR
jgi:hypothetical protein